MNIDEVLQNIGLTPAESKTYLALIKLGRSKAGRIIKITGLQSSVVHNSLNTLLEKGFITYILIGSIKEYNALDPTAIESYIESKKTEFKNILPALKSMQTDQEFDNAEMYQGYAGILNAMLYMVKDGRKGEIFKYFALPPELLSEETIKFFTKADLARKGKGIIIRGIATAGNQRLEDYTYSEIRFTKQKIPPAMNVFKDKILIISFANKPTAILIQSKEIADQYHKLWDEIWNASKKK